MQKSVPRALGPSHVSSFAVQRLRPIYGPDGAARRAPSAWARREVLDTGSPYNVCESLAVWFITNSPICYIYRKGGREGGSRPPNQITYAR